ncbi:MAG: tetratricopeptide repeat protein [Rhodoferax sp.]|nr:tetratricopeptide repeat protein [Rhodoferax sp.]
MRSLSFLRSALRWVLLAGFLSAGLAMAQQEPTMNQIYATAEAGKLDQAQVMVQQVLVAHPKSAKAYFVQAELYARQGNLPKAREALGQAQSLAPGLPFAKPEAVQALEKQLSARAVAAPAPAAATYNSAPSSSSGSWMMPALLAAAVIAAGYFIFRRKPAQTFDPNPAYGNGLSGPQTFGAGGMQPGMQGGYGQQPMYGQPGYGQPAGTGLGGRIMGGVATGLAVGAGVMAAEAIGRNLMGNHDGSRSLDSGAGSNYEPITNSNPDMGGQNFGISDTSWDDAGSSDTGGGDWDN